MTGNDRESRASWFQSTVQRYERQLVRYAARLVGDQQRAQDVVQDTFLQLCRKDPADLDGRLAAWLFAVCRNRALDVRQKESRMSELTERRENIHACLRTEPSSTAEIAETADRVAVVLAQLPENQQEVIRLKFQNGLSYREISEVTSLSVSNVGYLIHTAIKKMRHQLPARVD